MWSDSKDGVPLWWECDVSGAETVVLVPGRGDNSDLFPDHEFRSRLSASGLSVLSFDPRDTGLSGDGGDSYTISSLADDVISVVDAADATPFHLVGLSMGGMVLVDICRRRDQRVRSLTLLSAMSPDPNAGFGPQLFAPPPAEPLQGLLRAMGTTSGWDRAWAAAHLAAANQRAPARPDAADRHNEAAFRGNWPQLDDLGCINVPALIVHGELDESIPITHAHAPEAGLQDARLTVIPGMGHLPRPADWEQIADLVCDHVAAASST